MSNQWTNINTNQWVQDNLLQWFSEEEIATVSGVADLNAMLAAIPPADLGAIVNVIEVEDLPATITGDYYKGTIDLSSRIRPFDRKYKDLPASISSKLLKGYLAAYIKSTTQEYVDLNALVASLGGPHLDLAAFLSAVEAINLPVSMHGWDEKFLGGAITGGFGPGDLKAYILGEIPRDLGAIINCWYGYETVANLPAVISSFYKSDLPAFLTALSPADLGAYINVVGQSLDLPASIIPKVIRLKRAIRVSLLEHKDLKGLINFQCFGSGYSELSAYVYTLYKLDLKAHIIGWVGGTADNIKDLGAYINASDVYSQDVFSVGFLSEHPKYTRLDIRFNTAPDPVAFDTLRLIFGTTPYKDLTAYLTGTLTPKDLTASITPIVQANYTELPYNVYPKSHQVFIDFTTKWQENWRRFVEVMFNKDGAYPYHYFYVSGTGQVYKIDRSRHWTIWVKSYVEDEDNMVERRSVRKKYIFNMNNYSTVDEAVRDIMDRVAAYRELDLAANIIGALGPYKDLEAYLNSVFVYKWSKNLHSTIKALASTSVDFPANLNGEFFKGESDISVSITGKEYEPYDGDSLVFNFEAEDAGYTPPDYDGVEFNWQIKQAEQFWKT